ncbi:MAG: hypothetical protein KBT53_00900 [Porticoccus sp.]|nr:hypothetical protein [Porticoccus sp.]MBQ0807605.1 hypothetical protein [Porticoccus sp.]
MKLNLSLLAILTAAFVTPSLSLAGDHDRDDRHFQARASYAEHGYLVHFNANNYRDVKSHHRANDLDRKGDRIDQRLNRKGEQINRKLDRAAHRAWLKGDYRQARRLDQKGDRIERYYDRKGDQINRQLDRKAYRSDHYSNRHVQSYRHHQDRSDHKYSSGYDRNSRRDFKRDDDKGHSKGKHEYKKESDHHRDHRRHSSYTRG